MYRRQGARPSTKKKTCKKAEWLFGEALQIPVKRREAKTKEKRKDIPFECRVPKKFQSTER